MENIKIGGVSSSLKEIFIYNEHNLDPILDDVMCEEIVKMKENMPERTETVKVRRNGQVVEMTVDRDLKKDWEKLETARLILNRKHDL